MAKGKKKNKSEDVVGRRRASAPERRRAAKPQRTFSFGSNELIYSKRNYMIMGVGLLLICAGLLAMAGGAMPSPDVWDESIIYSARRITLAPILMLLRFGVVGYGIFAHDGDETIASEA